jgi:hypothetical protein
VIVTTDALAFQADVDRAATELAAAMHGNDLTCWMACSRP